MNNQYDVLVIGDINPDLMMIDYNRLPNPGEETHASGAEIALGGGCGICASGLAKLGVKVAAYGFVGDDFFGRMMVEKLTESGVDVGYVETVKEVGTGVSVALTTRNDRAFVTYEGTNGFLDVERIPDEIILSAGHVHVLCYAPDKHKKYLDLFKRIKRLGCTASFDLGYDDTGEWHGRIFEIVRVVDVFLPNDKEAVKYTKKETAEEALKYLASIGNTVVVKKGKDGAIGYRDGGFAEADSIAAKCIDTTGAGDSFNAGFLYGWLNGYELGDCLKMGNAAGGKSVECYGGSAGFPVLAELEALQRQCGGEVLGGEI